MTRQESSPQPLPACVTDYIDLVIRRMRYSRRARQEVRQELLDHFTDALADSSDPQERQKLAEELVAEFGDTKVLAALLRRAKKRNRPAWEKAIIRTSQAGLLLLAIFAAYTAWFVTGRPTISTDYITMMTEKMRPKASESENAWPLYRQAILHFVAPPDPVPDPTPPPDGQPPVSLGIWNSENIDLAKAPAFFVTAVHKCIDDNQVAWQDYVAASQKPCCWYSFGAMDELHDDMQKVEAERKGWKLGPRAPTTQPDELVWKDSVMMSLLPHLSSMRHLAKIGIYKAHLATSEGNVHEAIEDSLTVARVARHWQNPNGWMIEQLVGATINDLACQEIRRLAGAKALTASDLRHLQEQVEALYPAGYPAFGIETERVGFRDTVQRLFTKGGLGGGHLIPRQMYVLTRFQKTGEIHYDDPAIDVTSALAATGLLHASRDKTLAMANAYYDRVEEWSQMTPYQRSDQPNPDETFSLQVEDHGLRYKVLRMMMPSFVRASEMMWHARCEYEATLAVLGLQRYRLDKGHYPPNLETLVQAGYLRRLPADPYSNGPLVYRVGDDKFTLYSVAKNFRDDGGEENHDSPWEPGPRAASTQPAGADEPMHAAQLESGDRVFWPVAPLKPYPTEVGP